MSDEKKLATGLDVYNRAKDLYGVLKQFSREALARELATEIACNEIFGGRTAEATIDSLKKWEPIARNERRGRKLDRVNKRLDKILGNETQA
jgi:hypothetical protein